MTARLNAEAGTRLWVGASPIALCDLCTGVFKEPVTLPCGHSYCRQCLTDWRPPLSGRPCPERCPKSAGARVAELPVNKGLADGSASLRVHCRYGLRETPGRAGEEPPVWEVDPSGCRERLALADVARHEASCGYVLSRCPFASCGAAVRKRDETEHAASAAGRHAQGERAEREKLAAELAALVARVSALEAARRAEQGTVARLSVLEQRVGITPVLGAPRLAPGVARRKESLSESLAAGGAGAVAPAGLASPSVHGGLPGPSPAAPLGFASPTRASSRMRPAEAAAAAATPGAPRPRRAPKLQPPPPPGNWREIFALKGHQQTVSCTAFHPDGISLVSGSDDRTLRIWDAASGVCTRVLENANGEVKAVAFSPDGQQLLCASADKRLTLWRCGPSLSALGAAAAAGGGFMLDFAPLRSLSGHAGSVLACAFSADGRMIASGSADKSVRVWEPTMGTCLRVMSGGHSDWVRGVAFSPDGSRLLSCSDDKKLKLWRPLTGDLELTLSGHTGAVFCCAFSPDGAVVLSGGGNAVKLWSAASGECLRSLVGHTSSVLAVAFSPCGTFALSASVDKMLRLWRVANGEPSAQLEGHRNGVFAAAFSPDGRHIASGSSDTTIKLWRLLPHATHGADPGRTGFGYGSPLASPRGAKKRGRD